MTYSKKILLTGDSITHNFNTEWYFPASGIINTGISGNNTRDLLARLKRDVILRRPEIVFILIGTNDLAQGRGIEEIALNIGRIASKIIKGLPNSEIYLTSVLPTRDNTPRPNDIILKLNKLISAEAARNNVKYYEIHGQFCDAEGQLRGEYTDDGLHLNQSGYKIWADCLKEFLQSVAN